MNTPYTKEDIPVHRKLGVSRQTLRDAIELWFSCLSSEFQNEVLADFFKHRSESEAVENGE